uniref:Uncharacterized protein n=1 Tax=Candidatus Kentrum sp. UNK TaxID=2126344 RepID=A0A451AJI3_9GAMM|nr:MAG: hypothetical protein BECKUNK1418G_GA0071005_10835 [Candidatus Kentron sp. UNK]VFK71817.1 MAG: hypothetical protein BECKUNK1418H_GA0071006_10835 [Candidatus Kentron sp. UNK]
MAIPQCNNFVYRATHILFKRFNRKSQREAYNWDQFNQALKKRRLATRTHPQRPESLSKRGGLLND